MRNIDDEISDAVVLARISTDRNSANAGGGGPILDDPEIVLASATVRRGMRSIPGLWTRPSKVGGVRTSIPFQSGACTAVVPTARP
jgi:hypothetical protein